MHSFPTFNLDTFKDEREYKQFYHAAGLFQEYVRLIEDIGKIGNFPIEESDIIEKLHQDRNSITDVSSTEVKAIKNLQDRCIEIAREKKIYRWRCENSQSFQNDTLWDAICQKAKEKFASSDPQNVDIWQLKRKKWKLHARFAHYSSLGLSKVTKELKGISNIFKDVKTKIIGNKIDPNFAEEYQKYLAQVKTWKENTKQALIYAMVARLEEIAIQGDIACDDVLFSMYNQVNQLMGIDKSQSIYQEKAMSAMNPEVFRSFHHTIFKYQKKFHIDELDKRVYALPWFHDKSIPFGVKRIIHEKQLFILPTDVTIKKFSCLYTGPCIYDLAIYTIYWDKLQRLSSKGSLTDVKCIDNISQAIHQIVDFYLKQFDEIQTPVQDVSKELQAAWKAKIQKEVEKIFSFLVPLIQYFFKNIETNSKNVNVLCPIFYKLNQLADAQLSIGKNIQEYKKNRKQAEEAFGKKFQEEVLKQKIASSNFFKIFLTLVPISYRDHINILKRVFISSSSKDQQETVPLLEQVKDALAVIWPKTSNNLLRNLIEYLAKTVQDPKSPLLALIKQYDTSIQELNKKEPSYMVVWSSNQRERIRKVQEDIVGKFPLLEKEITDLFSTLTINEVDNAALDKLEESITLLQAYALFDKGPLNIVVDHLKKYIVERKAPAYSIYLFKALVILLDQSLLYEFGKKQFIYIKQSPNKLLTDKEFFQILSLCPQLLNELNNEIFEYILSHIPDVVQIISNVNEEFFFLTDEQKRQVLVVIDKYWFEQFQEYQKINMDSLKQKIIKAQMFTLFPSTDEYKKKVVEWINKEIQKCSGKINSAVEIIVEFFGEKEQKQAFFSHCFEQVLEQKLTSGVACEILLRHQILEYDHFLERYGKENVSRIFQSIENFLKVPEINSAIYNVLKSNLCGTNHHKAKAIVDSSQNSVNAENYSKYFHLCTQFEKIFQEQYSPLFDTVSHLEKGEYKKAYELAESLEKKLPAAGVTNLSEADQHAKEAMKMLLKNVEEWLQEQITNDEKYSIQDLECLINVFEKEFINPFRTKHHLELNEWLKPLSILCVKAKDIHLFYRNIQNILHSALYKSWLSIFANEDFPVLFELLSKSAKKLLLEQLVRFPVINQKNRVRKAWYLLVTILKGQSKNPVQDLEKIQKYAIQESKDISEKDVEKEHALLSERAWYTQLKILFPAGQGSEKEYAELLRLGPCKISKEVWTQLFDTQGKLLKGKENNRHVVIPVKRFDKTYYYKFLPDAPGIQWMSCALSALLWGEKNQKTFQIELAKFAPGTADNTRPYPVLISQEVAGKTLSQLWSEKPDLKLHVPSFSREFLRVLIDLEQDGKPENYIAVPLDKNSDTDKNVYQLINVDREQAFTSSGVLREATSTGKIITKLITKSILFCCSNMKEPIDTDVIKDFLTIDPIDFLKSFIHDVYRYNSLLLQLFSHSECLYWWNQKNECFLIAPLREDVIRSIFTTMCRMQDALQKALLEGKDITHIELLRNVHPLLANYYEPVLDEPIHPSKKFLKVVENEYQVIYNPEKDQEKFLTSRTSAQVVESIFGFIPKAQDAFASHVIGADRALNYLESIVHQKGFVQQAQEELISGVATTWKKITLPFYKEQVINGIPGVLPRIVWKNLAKGSQNFILQAIINEAKEKRLTLKALNLSNCSVVTNDILYELLAVSPELKSLDISDCANLDEFILRQLPFYCPALKILKIDGLLITSFSNGWWEAFSALEFSQLTYLSCIDCLTLERVVLKAPKLQVIHLQNCINLTKLSLTCPNFAHASLNGCAKLPNRVHGETDITVFDASKEAHTSVNIDFERIRKNSPRLKKFKEKLFSFKEVEELIIENPCSIEYEEKHPGTIKKEADFVLSLIKLYGQGIEHLNLNSCLWVNDSTLKAIILCCPNLETLVCANTAITDDGTSFFHLTRVQLKVLDISGTKCGDNFVSTLVKKCNNLKSIKLSKTYITDVGLKDLQTFGISLEKVDVSSCSAITSIGIARLLENDQIKKIDIANTQVNDELLIALIKYRAYIKRIKFDYQAQKKIIGDNKHDREDTVLYISAIEFEPETDIQKIIYAIPLDRFIQLKVLVLSRCKRIESIFNPKIKDRCPLLEALDISYTNYTFTDFDDSYEWKDNKVRKFTMKGCSGIVESGLVNILKNFNLEEIELSSANVSNTLIETLSSKKSLKKAVLTECTKIIDQGLVDLIINNPLEELDLSNTSIILEAFENETAVQQKLLKKVTFKNCSKITDKGLVAFLKLVPNIEELYLNETHITGSEFEKMPIQFDHLREIYLSNCKKLTDAGLLGLLAKSKNIETLCIAETDINFNLENFQKIGMQKLKRINLTAGRETKEINFLRLVQICPYIEEIQIDATKKGLGSSIIVFGPNEIISLKKISYNASNAFITNRYLVTDQELLSIVENCPNLEELELENTNVTCEILEKASKPLKNLKVFILKSCKKLTDKGLGAILKKCTKLETLIVDDTHITGETLKNLSTCLTSLTKLSLGKCSKLTEEGLYELLRLCPNIEELYVQNTSLSFEKLKSCKINLKKLKIINLEQCKKITEDTLITILDNSKYLEKIYIGYIDINYESFFKLNRRLFRLECIFINKIERFDKRSFSAILDRCPNLKSVRFNNCEDYLVQQVLTKYSIPYKLQENSRTLPLKLSITENFEKTFPYEIENKNLIIFMQEYTGLKRRSLYKNDSHSHLDTFDVDIAAIEASLKNLETSN